ncbi:hypothetical protein STZ1_10293 [Bacillus subtilis]
MAVCLYWNQFIVIIDKTKKIYTINKTGREYSLPVQRVDKPSHSLSSLRVGAHELEHSLRSNARLS